MQRVSSYGHLHKVLDIVESYGDCIVDGYLTETCGSDVLHDDWHMSSLLDVDTALMCTSPSTIDPS